NESRTGARRHEATDILAPRESPVIAVDAGPVKKLFLSVRGGLTVYQFDGSATYCYYYAHLDHYAQGLHEGQILKRGDLIGYVGTSGNARSDNSHLHFAIFKLGPEKEWWKGVPIDPYPVLLQLCGLRFLVLTASAATASVARIRAELKHFAHHHTFPSQRQHLSNLFLPIPS